MQYTKVVDKKRLQFIVQNLELNIPKNGKILDIPKNTKRALFYTKNNILPSRLVTALSGKIKNQKIPFECSLTMISPILIFTYIDATIQ